MYKENILKNYIDKSELRIYNKNLSVRLSKELAEKYDLGIYNTYLKHINSSFEKIKELNIMYPSNSNPILYIYIVPDDNFEELLQIPKNFRNGKMGGKPVPCFDLNGFNKAYGLSQNILENAKENSYSISMEENEIHELAHLVMNQFRSCNSTISEGFAEVLALYILDYENIFEEHKNALKKLNSDQDSVEELINQEKSNTFGNTSLLKNKSCSFRLSYISSYLFVRGCIEAIEKKYNINKFKATQKFLEILRGSNCSNEWLIYDIAAEINFDRYKLLNDKEMQLNIIKKL